MEPDVALGLALSASPVVTPSVDRAWTLCLAASAIEYPPDLTTVFISTQEKLIHQRIKALRVT